MGALYASKNDIITMWRPMTQAESDRVDELLKVVCASLREEAKKVGKDLDAMIEEDADLGDVAKSVTVDVVARTLMTSTNQEPMSQFTESGMGYSAGGTFLVPGGGLFIKRSELARLGLKRQRIGVIELYGTH